MAELWQLSMTELAQALKRGEASSTDATRTCLSRIGQVDEKVKAFLRVDEKGALAQAAASDERRARKATLSELDGVPVALKDILLTEGLTTTAGSKMLENFVPPFDATCVQRLRRAGLPIVGKLNQDEFAMGSSTENSAYFATRNPYDLTRTPGGSSGGSAAALAAREVFGTLGTDTGGSIRQPAAMTNTVGLKPTYGRVSRWGVIAFASSLDQVGPMARTVRDTAAMYELVAGHDENDSTSSRRTVEPCVAGLEDGVKGLRLGLPREYFIAGTDPQISQAVKAAAGQLEALGAKIEEVSLPHSEYALATYYLIAPAEASSNLGRYDGVRYGLRAKEAKGLREMYFKTRSEGFGPEVKRRIMLGTFALSAGYYDAFYLKAQKVRTLIRRDFEQAFEKVDALISPASPVPAFRLGEKSQDPLAMYLMDIFTIPASLAGLPALSVPCGFTTEGLPMGLQVIGPRWHEARILRVARTFEREHDFGARLPESA